MNRDNNPEEKNTLAIASVVVLVVFLLIVGGVYYWVSKRAKGKTVLPAGVNYLGPQNPNLVAVPTLDVSQIGKSGQWLQSGGKIFKYVFIYPAELQITAFINDPTDKIAWVTGIVSPQQNIAFNVESISGFDPKYSGKPDEFVKNFWRRFSGLSGVKDFSDATNQKGVKGYKALYTDKFGRVVTTNYFFPIPNDPDHILQVTNGFLPENIFNQIVNSVEFK